MVPEIASNKVPDHEHNVQQERECVPVIDFTIRFPRSNGSDGLKRTLLYTRSQIQIPPNASMKMYKYVDQKSLGAMHADHQVVSRCHTKGKSEELIAYRRGSQSGKKARKQEIQMPLEVQNRGISGPTKRTYVLHNNLTIISRVQVYFNTMGAVVQKS